MKIVLNLCCVYRISVRGSTAPVYIGATEDLQSRIWHHRSLLRRGKHGNRELQMLHDTHGMKMLTISVLEVCPYPAATTKRFDWMHEREAHHIATKQTLNVGPVAKVKGR